MQISKEQFEDILKKFQGFKKTVSECPICGTKEWAMSDTVFEIREFHGGGIVVGGESKILPVISLNCIKCGYTHFINAIALGVVPKPPITPEANK